MDVGVPRGRGSSARMWEFRADVGVPRGRGSSAWTWKFRVDVGVPRGTAVIGHDRYVIEKQAML